MQVLSGGKITEMPFDDGSVMARLLASLGPFGFVAVDATRVNLDDLTAPCVPGRIVRVRGNPQECITVFLSGPSETLGCVAGWISDSE